MINGPLELGDVLHGYAGGIFGRDWYYCARIEAMAHDWIVVRALENPQETAFCRIGTQEQRKWAMEARNKRFFYDEDDECEIGKELGR